MKYKTINTYYTYYIYIQIQNLHWHATDKSDFKTKTLIESHIKSLFKTVTIIHHYYRFILQWVYYTKIRQKKFRHLIYTNMYHKNICDVNNNSETNFQSLVDITKWYFQSRSDKRKKYEWHIENVHNLSNILFREMQKPIRKI